MYPENDDDFEEVDLTAVQREGTDGGWSILHGCTGFGCPGDSPVVPKVGMTARFYGGASAGSRVRGLFLDGTKVFYWTKAEDDQRQTELLYGKDAADFLARWDRGNSVHTIEMGGIGPGYEQAIQVAMFEILRFMLAEKPDASLWQDKDVWAKWRERCYALDALKDLGLSGAQAGAALSLASCFYMRGPQTVMADAQVKDRHIMVSKNFPRAA